MTYIPHTPEQLAQMLKTVGVDSTDRLFDVIPQEHRFPDLDLPPALSEPELADVFRQLSEQNDDLDHATSFLGAGAYHHYIPSIVGHVVSRSELYTAYTPYQPEVSQGTLQAIFEYQSMICALTGMDACNASHYDGATALAESIITTIAAGRGRRRRVVMAPSVHPQYRQVCASYTSGMDVDIATAGNPRATPETLLSMVDNQTACLIVQSPDYFGRIHDLAPVASALHDMGALLVVVTHPISLGLLKPPGGQGADIVVGDGQPLGNPLAFGGPHLGFFGCTKSLVRRMSGRLVGETVDDGGNRGYVLTLSTREQHIRRGKASSNICTNQGLNALAAAVYLSVMGKQGLAQVARLCYHKAHHAATLINRVAGFSAEMDHPFFNEFTVECPCDATDLCARIYDQAGIVAGYPLKPDFPDLANQLLVCVTEVNSSEQIAALAGALAEATA